MDKLKSMQVFVSVVENASFRKAAIHFDMSPTMVSKHIQYLETCLQTRLLNRTTRKQSVTESGRLYYKECNEILHRMNQAESLIQTLENRPTGTVRLNCPVTLGSEVLAPIIATFLQDYPSLNIEMNLDNSLLDPIKSGFDLFIRIGELHDSSLVARSLGDYKLVYCAAPSYLVQKGTPQDLAALSEHSCLGFVYSGERTVQHQRSDNEAFKKSNSRMASNNGHALKSAALHGAGIILQPWLLVREELHQGRLVEILRGLEPKPKPIHLLSNARQLSAKNRTCSDYLVRHMRRALKIDNT